MPLDTSTAKARTNNKTIERTRDRSTDTMRSRQRLSRVVAFVCMIGLAAYSPAARPQSTSTYGIPPNPESSDPGFHIGVTPYLWFSGIHGTVGVGGHEASVHASASDVLSNLDIGFMVSVEPRYNRLIFPVDVMWIRLSDTKGLPFDQGVTSIKATMTETIFTQKLGYRLVDQSRLKVDAVFGYRYWHGRTSFRVQPVSILNGISASAGWVDAVAGGKFNIGLTNKTYVLIFGDAGGGTAKLDYQVGGALGFQVSKKWLLQAGYRYMGVNYGSPSHFLYDVTMSGVVLGATWTPK